MAKILIVDDSSAQRLLLRKLLEKYRHAVVEAADGAAGVRLYGLMKPDLVTMDINMPEMGGIDAVDKIIARFPDARIIMISSEADEENVVKAIRNGARGYILKPFNEAKVVQVITKVLSE